MAIADFGAGVQAVLRQRMLDEIAAQEREFRQQQMLAQGARADRGLDLEDARLGLDIEKFNQPAPEPPPMVVGGRLVTRTGQVLYEPPKEPEKPERPVALSPGSRLIDPTTGRLIASAPTAPTKPERSMADVLAEYEAKKQIDAKYTGARPSLGAERNVLAYYNRAKQASDDISTLEEQIAGQGLLGQLQGQFAPNILQTENQQLYRQAQRAFTEARLRKESGAAIPQGEYDNDARTYFAQPGDSPAVIEQKRQARQVVLEGLKNASGRAYEEFHGEPNRPGSPAPAAAPTAKPTAAELIKKYGGRR